MPPKPLERYWRHSVIKRSAFGLSVCACVIILKACELDIFKNRSWEFYEIYNFSAVGHTDELHG